MLPPDSELLTNLILLIAIAYTSSCLVGLTIRNTGYQEYINRRKIEGKNRPRHSYFWTRLYGTAWVLSMDICWQWVEKLMLTAINKLPFYQTYTRFTLARLSPCQGMELINYVVAQSPFSLFSFNL